ncbi:MAG: ComEC/Rec2 family competence protein, partial [Acidaminococcaceae bacterium]|nr:ComEC/Rec2 family competence protein [Acidaminococcaceae bacterium]
ALPFLVHYFHQLSLVGLDANLFLVPLLEIAVLLTLVGFALLPLLGLGKLLFVLAGLLLLPLLKLIGWLAGWSWATITIGSWPYLCSAVYYLLLLLVLGNSDWDDFSNKERRLLIACCCFTLVGIGVYDKVRPQPLTVHFIDVGQGDAALVITPQRQTLLIDSGGLRGDYDTGRRIILPYLRYLGIRSLDVMLLSHGHHDHAGGAAAVAQNLPIGKIILPQEPPAADVQPLLRNAKAQVEYAQTDGQQLFPGQY